MIKSLFKGAAMFFIDFFGWFGAMRENVLCLLIYHTSMGIIIIAEIALIVLFGIGQHFISLIIESKLNDTVSLNLLELLLPTVFCCL